MVTFHFLLWQPENKRIFRTLGAARLSPAVSGSIRDVFRKNYVSFRFLSDGRMRETILLIYEVRPSAVSCIRSWKRLPEFPDHPSPYRGFFLCTTGGIRHRHGNQGGHVYILPETAGTSGKYTVIRQLIRGLKIADNPV